MTPNEAAWAFVLKHAEYIDALVKKMTRHTSLDAEDVRQDVIEKVVKCHAGFDPSKSKSTSWIWMVASSVVKNSYRYNSRHHREEAVDADNIINLQTCVPKIETRILARQIIGLATPAQAEAAMSKASGESIPEYRSAHGGADCMRRHHIIKLRSRAAKETR